MAWRKGLLQRQPVTGTEAEAYVPLFVDRFTKGLADLERRHPASGDGDGLPGARVSALAGRAALGGEVPEPGDAHRLVSCNSCVRDGQEHGVDREGDADHDEGARASGRIASLIDTCKINGVEPYAWLKDTLEKIAPGHSNSRIDDLMPWSFKPPSS